jgi:L-malate glycosyltransferase
MVAPENAPFIAAESDEVRLRNALQPLVADAALRRSVGLANQAKARAAFDEAVMIAQYKQLYERVLGREGALG